MSKEYFFQQATLNEPKLYQRIVEPVHYGCPIKDDSQWFQYRFEPGEKPQQMRAGDSFYIDFGNHYTGYLSFCMNTVSRYPDAPVKVRIKFAENLYELERSVDSCKCTTMSASWLQEEVLNIDEPSVVDMPRRYAFRYLKFTVEAMGYGYPISFDNFKLTAVTSADMTKYQATTSNSELQKMDWVGCHTLENCMQRVFEDGPRRDRRLWLGDLRLQALTGYYTLQSVNVAKRCMYLFAAHTEPGCRMPACIFQGSNETISDNARLADYALMFPVCLCDYFEYTGDNKVVDDLFSVADEQINIAWRDTEDGIFKELDGWWSFIDWCEGIEKITSMQGIFLYTLNKMIRLCQKTGREEKAEEYKFFAETLSNAAKEKLYDSKSGYFVNAYDRFQLSVHSQVWMVLGGVVEREAAQELMRLILQDERAKQAVTPYMHHYVVEALISADLKEEALEYIKAYWGEMIRCGADTYWEVFVPGDFTVSPYGDPVMNSCCHAWSCTVSYFIRKYWSAE